MDTDKVGQASRLPGWEVFRVKWRTGCNEIRVNHRLIFANPSGCLRTSCIKGPQTPLGAWAWQLE